jgi:hypothetical protein
LQEEKRRPMEVLLHKAEVFKAKKIMKIGMAWENYIIRKEKYDNFDWKKCMPEN